MVGGSPMKQAVLVAPGVKGRKVAAIKRDELKKQDAVAGLMCSIAAPGGDVRSAFFVLDLGRVIDLYNAWRRALPNMWPYYAVKWNPEPALLGALAALGAGFDCASRREIEVVLALGVQPGSIVYANPCKPEVDIEYAVEVGVNLTTYDSEKEVAKVKRCHPGCELILRIKGPENAEAKVDFGTKYGAHAGEVVPLLRTTQHAGLNVTGVSFHVGGSASCTEAYRGAVEAARGVFDAAAALGMLPIRVLDIGGGFTAGPMFDGAATVINDALARHFVDLPCVDLIGEPGRYFAGTTFTMAARVFGKRTRGEVREYWIDDGLYGALSCVLMDHYVPRPRPLAVTRSGGKTYTSMVFGPTCDSRNIVVAQCQLPEMAVGDWLVFDDIGAYGPATGSNFNGFSTSNINTYLAYSG